MFFLSLKHVSPPSISAFPVSLAGIIQSAVCHPAGVQRFAIAWGFPVIGWHPSRQAFYQSRRFHPALDGDHRSYPADARLCAVFYQPADQAVLFS